MNDKRNVLLLTRNNLIVKMVPLKLKNIELKKHPIFDFSEALLYPEDVYVLSISGQLQEDTNYLKSIVKFGKKRGFKLAHEKYPQVPVRFRDQVFYFVIHDPIVNKLQRGRGLKLGNLPDHPKVEVSLGMVSSYGDNL